MVRSLFARIASIVLLVMFASSLPYTSSASVRVEPARQEFVLAPGEKATGVIEVSNPEDREIEVTAILYDWTINEADKLVVAEPGTRPDTLDQMIKFNPRRFVLMPGATQYVRFTVEGPPQGSCPERRGIVFFEEETPYIEGTTGARILTQTGATIYVTSTLAQTRIGITGVDLVELDNLSLAGLVSVSNAGDAHCRFWINHSVLGEDGALLDQGQTSQTLLLPGRDALIPISISEEPLSPGQYSLLLELKVNDVEQTLVRTARFSIE